MPQMTEKNSELSRQHVNLQAMKQPAFCLIAFSSTLQPTAQYGLQMTELRTGKERKTDVMGKQLFLN